MGMVGPGGIGLDPAVVKEMARNFGGLYQMLPGRLWYNRSPFDGAYDARYLEWATMVFKEGIIVPTYTVLDRVPYSYDQTLTYLASYYNAALVQAGDQFSASALAI